LFNISLIGDFNKAYKNTALKGSINPLLMSSNFSHYLILLFQAGEWAGLLCSKPFNVDISISCEFVNGLMALHLFKIISQTPIRAAIMCWIWNALFVCLHSFCSEKVWPL